MQHNVNTVGSDLAKTILPLVGTDTPGTRVWRQRRTRQALGPFLAQLPRCPLAWRPVAGPSTGRANGANTASKSHAWRPRWSRPTYHRINPIGALPQRALQQGRGRPCAWCPARTATRRLAPRGRRGSRQGLE